MERYITENGTPGPWAYTLWETDGATHRALSHHEWLEDIEGHAELDLHRFEQPTSFASRTTFNRARGPVGDGEGRPIWPGARIAFRVGGPHRDAETGTGTAVSVSEHYGLAFVADRPLPVYETFPGVGPCRVGERREHYFPYHDHQVDGAMFGLALLRAPVDRAGSDLKVEVVGDPREACVRLEPAHSPSMRG